MASFWEIEMRETVTVSDICAGNVVVLIASLMIGRIDLGMGTCGLLANIRCPKLKVRNTHERVASVVMLSTQKPNSYVKQFMRYICNAYYVDSILLQCLHLKLARVTAEFHATALYSKQWNRSQFE